ncbi:MAG: hypothetical protein ACC634_09140 [Hyphomicrobiales bacterium]
MTVSDSNARQIAAGRIVFGHHPPDHAVFRRRLIAAQHRDAAHPTDRAPGTQPDKSPAQDVCTTTKESWRRDRPPKPRNNKYLLMSSSQNSQQNREIPCNTPNELVPTNIGE